MCLRELRQARQAGVLLDAFDPNDLVQRAGGFARYADPQAVLEAQWGAVEQMAEELRRARFATLAYFISLRPEQGVSLLVMAVRYFFRRQLETDTELFQGLNITLVENLSQQQVAGFAALADALTRHGQRLQELLGDVQELLLRPVQDGTTTTQTLARHPRTTGRLTGTVSWRNPG